MRRTSVLIVAFVTLAQPACDDQFVVSTDAGGSGGSLATNTSASVGGSSASGSSVGGSSVGGSSAGGAAAGGGIDVGGAATGGQGGVGAGGPVRRVPDSATPFCCDNATNGLDCTSAPDGQDGKVTDQAPLFAASGGATVETISQVNFAQDEELLDWTGAVAFCDSYNGGGHDDWRIPTLLEMMMTADFGVNGWAPNPGGFGFWQYWVTHPNAPTSDGPDRWVYFINAGATTQSTADVARHVRCVRGPELEPDFEPLPAVGQYTEALTGLTWDFTLTGTSYDWETALDACPAGWRLPTIKEGFVVGMAPAPLSSGIYWSSTPYADPNVLESFVIDLDGFRASIPSPRTMGWPIVCVTPTN